MLELTPPSLQLTFKPILPRYCICPLFFNAFSTYHCYPRRDFKVDLTHALDDLVDRWTGWPCRAKETPEGLLCRRQRHVGPYRQAARSLAWYRHEHYLPGRLVEILRESCQHSRVNLSSWPYRMLAARRLMLGGLHRVDITNPSCWNLQA